MSQEITKITIGKANRYAKDLFHPNEDFSSVHARLRQRVKARGILKNKF